MFGQTKPLHFYPFNYRSSLWNTYKYGCVIKKSLENLSPWQPRREWTLSWLFSNWPLLQNSNNQAVLTASQRFLSRVAADYRWYRPPVQFSSALLIQCLFQSPLFLKHIKTDPWTIINISHHCFDIVIKWQCNNVVCRGPLNMVPNSHHSENADPSDPPPRGGA